MRIMSMVVGLCIWRVRLDIDHLKIELNPIILNFWLWGPAESITCIIRYKDVAGLNFDDFKNRTKMVKKLLVLSYIWDYIVEADIDKLMAFFKCLIFLQCELSVNRHACLCSQNRMSYTVADFFKFPRKQITVYKVFFWIISLLYSITVA